MTTAIATSLLAVLAYADEGDTVARWAERAEQGLTSAQVLLGFSYRDGEGAPQDYAEAARWFRLAAEKGDMTAQAALGRAYLKGEGVPQDYAAAARLYEAAAEQGHAGAAYHLGLMYYAGLLSKDYAEAERWLLAAAEHDDEGNIDWPSWPIGRRLMSIRSSALMFLCRLIGEDAVLRLQAEKGNPYAQTEFADRYFHDSDDADTAYAWQTVAYRLWVSMDRDERDRRSERGVFRSSVHLKKAAGANIARRLLVRNLTSEHVLEGTRVARGLQDALPERRWGGMLIQCHQDVVADLPDINQSLHMLWKHNDPRQLGVTFNELQAHARLILIESVNRGVRYDGPYGETQSYVLTPHDEDELRGEEPGGMMAYMRHVTYQLFRQYLTDDEIQQIMVIPGADERHLLEPRDGKFMPPRGAYERLPFPIGGEGWHIINEVAPELMDEYEQIRDSQDRARFAVAKLQMVTAGPGAAFQNLQDVVARRTEINEAIMVYYTITGMIHAYEVDTRNGAFAVQIVLNGPWYPAVVPSAHGGS